MRILNDLIQHQFPIKQQAIHSNNVAETFNFVVIVSIMLTGKKKIKKSPS